MWLLLCWFFQSCFSDVIEKYNRIEKFHKKEVRIFYFKMLNVSLFLKKEPNESKISPESQFGSHFHIFYTQNTFKIKLPKKTKLEKT